jgi:6,7-dimethyl-8-ribityllumazine synthase
MAGRSSAKGGAPETIKAHILIIEARYHEAIADALAEGAVAALTAAGATCDRVSVPGALEIPQVLAAAVGAGIIPSDAGEARYDGAIALGCVIRGETTHYETVCTESNRWLMDVAIRHGVPVGNGILTVETEAQAMARASGGLESKGADAARACLALIHHARAFERLAE